MTFDELKKIDNNALDARRLTEKLHAAAQSLARVRKADLDKGLTAVLGDIESHWRYGSDAMALEAFHTALGELLPEALRIAELRLEAQARAASARARALTEQVRSFFDEEQQPKGEQQ